MEYKPLNFTTFEFRLLVIMSIRNGDNDDTIQCSLDHSLLIEPPEYRALSYCWGDPGRTARIIVNGHPVQVTTNLEAALREMRHQGLMMIWVDALCINQCDVVERGLQVSRMGLVYSRALEVIVWLGEEAEGSARAMICLKKAARKKPLGTAAPPITKPAILALLLRPFWRRVWIIQEVSKARKLRVFCGSQNIHWSEMFDVLESWQLSNMGLDRPELVTGLFETIHSLSTDPRDKIFAILGLCSDGPYLVQSPNYVQPSERIYFDLLMALVSRNRELNYLARQTTLSGPSRVDNSPHPDWTMITNGMPFWILKALQPKEKDPTETIEGLEIDSMASACFPGARNVGPTGLEGFPFLTFTGLRASVVFIDSILTLPNRRFDRSNWNEHSTDLPEACIDEARRAMTCYGDALLLYDFSTKKRKKRFDHELQVSCALTYLYTKTKSRDKFTDEFGTASMSFYDWYKKKQFLEYRGRTLKEWARIYSKSSEYKSEASELFASGLHEKWIRDTVANTAYRLIKGVEWATKHNLCLATGQETRVLQLVPCEVREGDLVCRIRYSRAPIFIRPEGNGSYRFVSFSRACLWLRVNKYHHTRGIFSEKLNKIEIWDWVDGVVEDNRRRSEKCRRQRQAAEWKSITVH
ncbi:uncharacterized protein PAC_06511 [Phialocephala subalpina]|uniref:Heterokaryon incompatibility domain-containing protein n=1 Tax=Phialocephala subalpina TaxID=576137 RepID=A0A1L7WV23_9HELO|nr:uncharacterized protein PAC_06511 [Phialocephala subalpina]